MFMTIKDIKVWCSQKGLSDQAIKEIEFIRNSEPSRRVRSRLKNVSGFYPSKKMGLTIQFESRTVELAAIYEKEHDETVIEYYDQPPSFRIKYLVNGKIMDIFIPRISLLFPMIGLAGRSGKPKRNFYN